MATRKEQLDAFNFARRRTVANLVVPSATGSDEGAPRPVRTFATSIILSAIAVAAVAVLGVFKPAAPSGWQNGLAVDSSTGATYIDRSNELHSVYNITSARLVLGTDFAKFDVPDSTLNSSGIPIGSPVGILGAPEDVPAASDMNLTQWSYCQNEKSATDQTVPGGQTYLEIGYWPTSPGTSTQGMWTDQSNHALIVHDSSNQVFLIEGDYRYLVGDDDVQHHSDVQTFLADIAGHPLVGNDVTGYWVSDTWLSAFPMGGAFAYPTLPDYNATPRGPDQLGPVGAYGPTGSGGGVVQTENGIAELDPVAYSLYTSSSTLTADGVEKLPATKLTASAITAAGQGDGGTVNPATAFEANTYSANWPTANPSISGTDTTDANAQNLCVGYQYAGATSVSKLTVWLSAQLPYGSAGGQFGLNQKVSSSYANTVLVKPGYGLIAQGATGTVAQNYEYLIEDSGYRYALLSDPATSGSSQPLTAAGQLGYGHVTVQSVPIDFLDLIQPGAQLDPKAAGESPGTASLG